MSIEELLKKWNGGFLRGAKKALADILGVPDTWIAGMADPSEKHIKKWQNFLALAKNKFWKVLEILLPH